MRSDTATILDRALATHEADRRDLWAGQYAAHPELLELDRPCLKCGAAPFRPCRTPSHYPTKPHAGRING